MTNSLFEDNYDYQLVLNNLDNINIKDIRNFYLNIFLYSQIKIFGIGNIERKLLINIKKRLVSKSNLKIMIK